MKNSLTPLAKELRKRQTDAEQKLWLELRGRRLEGVKFKRQVPKGNYIVDFVCEEKKLIVEVDGSQHMDERAEYDEERTVYLENEGYRVIRFWSNEVLTNIKGVLLMITEVLDTRSD